MSQSARLQRVIDRLVEDAIRRILPAVMNEVLLRTIADSGVLSEDRPPPRRIRRKPGPKKRPRQRLREDRPIRSKAPVPPARSSRVELSELLDESAGSEFYEDPRPRRQGVEEYEVELDGDDEEDRDAPTKRTQPLLNPMLQALAEDVRMPEDDGGQEWLPGEYDATGPGPVHEVKDVGRAAAALGIDFARMAGTIRQTSPVARPDAEDVRAKAQFESQRLKRLRENLNDGKPVE